MTAQDLLTKWRELYPLVASSESDMPVLAWQVQRPFAILLSRKLWSVLACPPRIGRGNYGSTASLFNVGGRKQYDKLHAVALRGRDSNDKPDVAIHPDQLEHATDVLINEWSSRIIQTQTDAIKFAGIVSVLRSTTTTLRQPFENASINRRQRCYPIVKIIKYVLMAGCLRDAKDLSLMCWKMMDTLQPGLSKYIKDEMTRVSLLGYQSLAPSPSTITRYKLSLDVGYMVYRAAHAHEREEASIYMLADSSPQLRHDFLWWSTSSW